MMNVVKALAEAKVPPDPLSEVEVVVTIDLSVLVILPVLLAVADPSHQAGGRSYLLVATTEKKRVVPLTTRDTAIVIPVCV